MPRIEGFDASRWKLSVNHRAFGAHWVESVFEEAPEPCSEEHDLRHDEKDNSVAQADLDNGRVVASVAFVNNLSPPAVHDVEGEEEARDHDEGRYIMKIKHRSEEQHKACKSAEQRPC